MNPLHSTVVSRTAFLSCAVAAAMWSFALSSPVDVAAQANPATAQDHDHDAAQQEPGAHVHEDAATVMNPVPSAPASIAAGKALFDRQCVSCHGAAGKGDGKSAAQLTPKPSDLTDTSWKHGSSDGEIFTLIKDGSKNTAMRGFASRMTIQEMWNVVNYLRTLSTNK